GRRAVGGDRLDAPGAVVVLVPDQPAQPLEHGLLGADRRTLRRAPLLGLRGRARAARGAGRGRGRAVVAAAAGAERRAACEGLAVVRARRVADVLVEVLLDLLGGDEGRLLLVGDQLGLGLVVGDLLPVELLGRLDDLLRLLLLGGDGDLRGRVPRLLHLVVD